MLFASLLFILIQLVFAVTAPLRFVYLALWIQTMPYTWNWDVDRGFDTPVGQLNVVAMQVFGICLCCILALVGEMGRAAGAARYYRWHVLFLVFCILSLTYASSTAYGLRMIAKLSAPLLFLIVVLTSVRSADDVRRIQGSILGGGIVLIGLALLAKVFGIRSDPNAVDTGISGLGPPGMGPPVFSAHMLAVAMLALALYIARPRLLTLALVVACAASIIGALERTSAAAMYVGFSVILFFGTRGIWRVLLPTAGMLGLPTLLIFSDAFRRRMFYGVTSSDALLQDPNKAIGELNSSGRFALWDNVLTHFFRPHPVMGSGIGATQEYLYAISATGRGAVHSEYVRLLCEVGVIGLCLFAIAMFAYLLRLKSYLAAPVSPAERTAALAAMGALIAYLLFYSTDNGIDYVSQFGIYVFALIGAAIKSCELGPIPREEPHTHERQALFPNLMRW